MTDEPNARELLKEAREIIAALAKWNKDVEAIIGKVPNTGFQNASDTLAKLDAYLAAPSESAMEMVRKIREGFISQIQSGESKGWLGMFYKLSDIEAAAQIEGYGRRVPRAMLEEIFEQYPHYIPGKEPNAVKICIDAIAAKHGVVIE